MERRARFSDRGNQLRQVQADNSQRKLPSSISASSGPNSSSARRNSLCAGASRAEGGSRRSRACSAARDRSTGSDPQTLAVSGYPGSPDVANARADREQDQWDRRAKAWRETRKTIEWETGQVARSAAAIEEWRRKHPVQALAIRTGLKKPPADLQRLEQTHAEAIRFLEGSQRRFAELEQAWPKKRLVYQQQLEREGEEIRKAKRFWG